MNKKIVFLSLLVLASMIILTVSSQAQDAEKLVEPAATIVSDQVDKTMASEEMSIYGEIQSVSAEGAGSMTVQYYDYDADDEKTIVMALDANTKLENAGSVADIKKGDWADVTYSSDGAKNKALSIIVEKEEEIAVPPQPEPQQAVSAEKAAVSESVSN